MARLTGTRVQSVGGKSLISSRLYRLPSKTNGDIYVITQAGDRLDLLAHQFYGDSTLWYAIASTNGVGKGTYALEPGIQLRIPANPGAV